MIDPIINKLFEISCSFFSTFHNGSRTTRPDQLVPRPASPDPISSRGINRTRPNGAANSSRPIVPMPISIFDTYSTRLDSNLGLTSKWMSFLTLAPLKTYKMMNRSCLKFGSLNGLFVSVNRSVFGLVRMIKLNNYAAFLHVLRQGHV